MLVDAHLLIIHRYAMYNLYNETQSLETKTGENLLHLEQDIFLVFSIFSIMHTLIGKLY